MLEKGRPLSKTPPNGLKHEHPAASLSAHSSEWPQSRHSRIQIPNTLWEGERAVLFLPAKQKKYYSHLKVRLHYRIIRNQYIPDLPTTKRSMSDSIALHPGREPCSRLLRRRIVTFVVMGKNNQAKLSSNQAGNWHRSLKTHKFMPSTTENNVRRQVRYVQQQSVFVRLSGLQHEHREKSQAACFQIRQTSFLHKIQSLWAASARRARANRELLSGLALQVHTLWFLHPNLWVRVYVGLSQAAQFSKQPNKSNHFWRHFNTRQHLLARLISIR